MKYFIACILILMTFFGANFGMRTANEQERYIARRVYVDASAPNGGNGTEGNPFNTIEDAKLYVKTLSREEGDIVVEIADGTYNLTEALVFTSADGGEENSTVSYVAREGATPVISGGEKISGWTLHDGENNIYKARVPTGVIFRQLYVGGKLATRARSGSANEYTTRIAGAERIKESVVLPELMVEDSALSRAQADDGTIFINQADGTFNENWGNLEKVELHVFTAWCVNILRVKSCTLNDGVYGVKIQDEEADLVFNRPHPNLDGYTHRNFIYYVENAYELMDEDDEWYLDESTATLYYKAPLGVNLNELEVVYPSLETLVKIEGTLENPIKNLTFSGLTFRYSAWNEPTEHGFVDGQAMQYVTRATFKTNDVAVARPSAGILVQCAENVEFRGNVIENMGATGIDLYYGTKNCTVQNNVIQNICGNGVSVGKFVEDQNVDYHVPYNPKDEREICTNDKIVNNVIFNVGTYFESAVGVACGYPKNILIANNTISYVPYTGISVGFGWTKEGNAMSGNRIIRNDIHHVTTVLCDAGAIYTLSEQPNSEITENYIHDITLTPWADYGTSGIYLDEGTGGYVVTDNVIEKAYGINPHVTGVNYIYDNIISTENVVNTARARRIKANAGVQEDFSLATLPRPQTAKNKIIKNLWSFVQRIVLKNKIRSL